MRNLKRALSLALATVMTMGLMVVGSSASYSDVVATDNVEAIEVAQAVGVMVGDENGNFNPDQQVTRAEMAVVMANLLDLNINNFTGASLSFTDVPDWAVPYVAACAADGIVSGYSDTTFGSNDTVTAAQAGLMVLKALGYFQNATDFGSDWQLATIKQANRAELYGGISAGATTALTRNDVAQLVLNALEATMVEVDGNSGTTITGNGFTVTTGSTQYSDVTKSDTKYRAIKGNPDSDGKYTVQLGEDLFDGDLRKVADTDDLGRPATTWTYKTTEIGKYADEADYSIVLSSNYKGTTDHFVDTLADLMGKKVANVKLDGDGEDIDAATVTLNGEEVDLTDAENDVYKAQMIRGTVVEIYLNEDDSKYVDNVAIYYYQLDKITNVNTDVKTADANDGTTAYISFENTQDHNDDDIPGFNANTYVEGAYVALVKNGSDKIIASAVVDTVEGSVSTVTAGSGAGNSLGMTLTVNGTKYYSTYGYNDGLTDQYVAAGSIKTGSDNSYVLYLDPNGYVVGVEGVKASTSVSDVYYVDNAWAESNTVSGKEDVLSFYAQLVNVSDGTITEVQLEKAARYGATSDSGVTVSENANYTADTVKAWNHQLVTISDKKWSDANGTTYSASNSKYDLEVWDYDADDLVKYEANGTSDLDISKTAKSATINGKSYRLNSSTVYILVKGDQDELETSLYTGGLSFTKTARSIVITEKNSATAKYVMLFTDSTDQSAEYSEDMVYIKSNSDAKGDGYREQDVYVLSDGKLVKETWNVDESEYASSGALNGNVGGFYTYDTNKDGYYTFSVATAPEIDDYSDGVYAWKDEEGVLVDAILKDDAGLEDGTVLTVTGSDGNVYTNLETSGAAYLDLRSDSDRKATYASSSEKYTAGVAHYKEINDLAADATITGTVKVAEYEYTASSLKAVANILDRYNKGTGTATDGTSAYAVLNLNISEDGVVSVIVRSIVVTTVTTPAT
jgi:hypothetical protein